MREGRGREGERGGGERGGRNRSMESDREREGGRGS